MDLLGPQGEQERIKTEHWYTSEEAGSDVRRQAEA